MADIVYSIQIKLESVKIADPDDGDVYFIARVNGTSRGRSKVFPMSGGQTADLKPLGWIWDFQVLGSPGSIPLELEAWDKDWPSADDDLGKVTTSVSGPWTARQVKVSSPGGNLELTYSIGVTAITLTRSSVAVVSRHRLRDEGERRVLQGRREGLVLHRRGEPLHAPQGHEDPLRGHGARVRGPSEAPGRDVPRGDAGHGAHLRSRQDRGHGEAEAKRPRYPLQDRREEQGRARCGDWDWVNQVDRTSCCMCYWFQFVLDDGAPRKPIPWTQNRTKPNLCAMHIRRMRDYHLEVNLGLGWGGP